MTPNEIHQANVALAYKYDAFNDPLIKELGLCPVCLVQHPCICERNAMRPEPPPPKSWWRKLLWGGK